MSNDVLVKKTDPRKVYLAMRRGAATGAKLHERFFCWLIKFRLASPFCHGGMVIGGTLVHATLNKNVHAVEPQNWNPANWELREVVGLSVETAQDRFSRFWRGKKYDKWGILSFLFPSNWFFISNTKEPYCFELCYSIITGETYDGRVPPERVFIAMADRAAEYIRRLINAQAKAE